MIALRTPPQFDDFQTNYDCGTSPIDDTQMMQGQLKGATLAEQCFDGVQAAFRSVLQTLPTAVQRPFSGVYSSTCSDHCTSGGADMWTILVGGRSLASMLSDWWHGLSSAPSSLAPSVELSSCIGYSCMALCVPEERKFPSYGFGASEAVAR